MSNQEISPQTPVRPQINWFVLMFLAFHVPLFVYPILRLSVWLSLPLWLTLTILIPLVSSQIVARFWLRGSLKKLAVVYRKTADFWLGMSPVLLMLMLVFEFVLLVTGIATHIAALWVVTLTTLISFIGLIVAISPRVKTISLTSSRLQAPVRFVQITDVHIGSRSQSFLERLMFRINRLHPDFLCITGDFIDAPGITEDQLQSLARADYPIYFCIGNHEKYEDLEDILQRLDNLGVKILRSDTLHFRKDIQIIGIDDMEDPLQVEKELKHIALDAGAFKLLLYHRPRGLEAAAEHGIDLILSGHTHNGQIFPFNLIVKRVFERIIGMYSLGETRQYVSQGTGTWGPVMRLGTYSEITLFEYDPE